MPKWHIVNAAQRALVALGEALRRVGYRFETVTPATQARVLARPERGEARDLRDVFGWSLPFRIEVLPSAIADLSTSAGAIETLADGRRKSRVRFSSLGQHLLAHSAYPTTETDAVFFGPDTVRFAHLLEDVLSARVTACARALDLGCGTGAGGVVLADAAEHVVMSDISPRAIEMAQVNAALAGVSAASFVVGDLYASVEGAFDLIAANPPYLVDDAGRTYRDGGGPLGIDLAVRIVREGLPRLSPGGTLVLYTGVPIVGGRDALREATAGDLERAGARVRYREIDPDVFGEELERPAYRETDRIAVIGLVASVP